MPAIAIDAHYFYFQRFARVETAKLKSAEIDRKCNTTCVNI